MVRIVQRSQYEFTVPQNKWQADNTKKQSIENSEPMIAHKMKFVHIKRVL